MSELAETIERVVREVLAGMGHTVAAARAPASEPRADSPTTSPAAAATRGDSQPAAANGQDAGDNLVMTRRVVTLADLPERSATVRRVIVPLGTVVTPAAQDELQQRKIKLVVGEPDGAAKAAKTILTVAAATYDPAALAVALEREGFTLQTGRMDCLIRATDQLAAELAAGSTMGLLVTAYPAAAVCLANRHPGVRAILGTRADTVAGDAQSVGANLLVIDPGPHGFFALKQMATRFLRGGPRICPEVFRKRLEKKA
jgi:hypothetical protein